MPNAFDTSNARTTEPAAIIAGDFTAWRRTDLASDYPPASYALSYELRSEGEPSTKITLTATEDNGDFLIQIPSATSAAYAIGVHHWTAYITRISDNQFWEHNT